MLILQQLRTFLKFIGRLAKSRARLHVNVLQHHISLELVLILNLVDIRLLITGQILSKYNLRFVLFEFLSSDSQLEILLNSEHQILSLDGGQRRLLRKLQLVRTLVKLQSRHVQRVAVFALDGPLGASVENVGLLLLFGKL